MTKQDTGTILEIQRMSTEDGPGIRTTIFFKGCTLKCLWCHNPESISPKPQIQWVGSRCIGCKSCIAVCPNGALSLDPGGMDIDRSACNACGACVIECPTTAMEMLGQAWTVEALADEAAKDKVYFEQSGGGITVSGGEPTMQAPFAAAFLKECRQRGIATAIDTCGQCGQKELDLLLEQADHILFDIKIMDSKLHKAFCGHGNEKILASCIRAAGYAQKTGKKMWVRTPIIPGATDSQENITAIGGFIAKNLGNAVERWDLCAFNNLCRDKYLRLGLVWEYEKVELLEKALMEKLAATAKKSGVNRQIVRWSGATRLEGE
jgi:pyruvate formate lyase activating enzyme